MYVGSDTDQLRSTAGALDSASSQIESLMHTLHNQAENLDWVGFDADVFRSQMAFVIGCHSGGVRQHLDMAGMLLRIRAVLQDAVSATLGSGGNGGSDAAADPAVAGLSDETNALLDKAKDVLGGIGTTFDALGLNAKHADVAGGLGVMFGGLSLAGSVISSALPAGGLRDSVDILRNTVSGIGGVNQAIGGISHLGDIGKAVPLLSKVGGAFAIVGGGIGLYQNFQSFQDGVKATEVVSAVSNGAKMVGGVMMFTPLAPVGAIIIGASAVVDAGVWMVDNWDKVENVAGTVTHAVADAGHVVGEAAYSAATSVVHTVDAAIDTADAVVNTVTSSITHGVSGALSKIGGLF